MARRRTFALVFSALLAAFVSTKAQAIEFWKTIGMCASHLAPATLKSDIENFGWQAARPSNDRAADHSAMFNFHYHLAWGKGAVAIETQRRFGDQVFLRHPFFVSVSNTGSDTP